MSILISRDEQDDFWTNPECCDTQGLCEAQARKIFAELKKPCEHSGTQKTFEGGSIIYNFPDRFKRECPLCIAEMESEL
jgi:hypothetical protein